LFGARLSGERLGVALRSLLIETSEKPGPPGGNMSQQTLLVELILGGFFAVACMRTSVPSSVDGSLRFSDLMRLPGRIERLRRSRWQWFSMVALLLVIRLQKGMPLVLEATVALMFLLFVALPTRATTKAGARG
jgi:hypothetical protein